MAWPSATAPPLTFTFCGSMPSSLSTATACTANASFSSKRSTSSSDQSIFAASLRTASSGVIVLCLAADVVVLGDRFAGVAHVALLERAPQTVVDHRVDDLRVPHAQAVAYARQEVGTAAHRLHSAGDRHVDVAGADALIGEHHGFEAGAAYLINSQRRDMIGQSAPERG